MMNHLHELTRQMLPWSVGFERAFDRALDLVPSGRPAAYPPYNIKKLDDDAYQIEVAVAGFDRDDLDVSLERGVLTIHGEHTEVEDVEGAGEHYLHRGIAKRSFDRRFTLAEHIEVAGADLRDGLLVVDLERRVPEEQKVKQIPIK